jgi:hypothetical protein
MTKERYKEIPECSVHKGSIQVLVRNHPYLFNIPPQLRPRRRKLISRIFLKLPSHHLQIFLREFPEFSFFEVMADIYQTDLTDKLSEGRICQNLR